MLSGIRSPSQTPPESRWTGLSTETDSVPGAVDCGHFPAPDELTDAFMIYSEDGVNNLEAYRACSEANQGNADDYAAEAQAQRVQESPGRDGARRGAARQHEC